MMQGGQLVAGRFRLQRLLGEGGVAEVWLAQDESTGQAVALKVLRTQYIKNEGLLERFRREATLISQVSSPYIVQILGVNVGGNPSFLVLEYVDGQDLKEWLQFHAPLPVEQALTLLRDISRGVAAAHAVGLIHRDLKPGNVLLSSSGALKITDFGIARAVAAGALTEPGMVWGTSHYLAPEQAASLALSPATDVYALGVILFEMLTGRVPFPGDDPVAVAIAHLQEPVPDVQALRPSVPAGVARLVKRMMDKSPERRPRDGAALLQIVEGYLSRAGGATTHRPTLEEIDVAPRRAHPRAAAHAKALPIRLWAPFVAVLLLGVMVAGAILLLRARPPLVGGATGRNDEKGSAIVGQTPALPTFSPVREAASQALPRPSATPSYTPTVTPTATPAQQRLRVGNGPDAIAEYNAPARITVDGNLNEWSSQWVPLTNRVHGVERWSGLNDLSGQAAFAWDETFLYLAVERTDDFHVQDETQVGYDLYRGDAVELWLDSNLTGDFDEPAANEPGGLADDFQFALGAGNYSTLRPEGVVLFPRRDEEWNRQVRVRAEPLPNGYTLEVSIPWALMGVTARDNLALGYAIVLNDNDPPASDDPQTQIASTQEQPFQQPLTFGNLILAPR